MLGEGKEGERKREGRRRRKRERERERERASLWLKESLTDVTRLYKCNSREMALVLRKKITVLEIHFREQFS